MPISLENIDSLYGLPRGYDAQWLAKKCAAGESVQVIVRDDGRMHQLREAILFFAPDAQVLMFPAWDCVPSLHRTCTHHSASPLSKPCD